jgi:hypothetical protein
MAQILRTHEVQDGGLINWSAADSANAGAIFDTSLVRPQVAA